MASFNKVILVGNLTRDPELKQAGAGTVCRLSMASNRQFKNRQTGSMIQEVCYIDVDVWGAQAETCKQYLQKGRQVMIEGRLKQDVWKDNEGQTRSKHSIVADRVIFLGSQTGSSVGDEPADEVALGGSTKSTASFDATGVSFKDEPPFDDLPF
jgi:single-strand DNA-binding protein